MLEDDRVWERNVESQRHKQVEFGNVKGGEQVKYSRSEAEEPGMQQWLSHGFFRGNACQRRGSVLSVPCIDLGLGTAAGQIEGQDGVLISILVSHDMRRSATSLSAAALVHARS